MRGGFAAWVLLSLSAVAWAQPMGPDEEIARRHFEQGRSYYSVARYNDALEEFEAARSVRPVAALDFNIGRCLDRMERFADAIVAYQRYVDASPQAADVGEVRERIAALRARVGTAPRPAPQLIAPPISAPAASRHRTAIAVSVSLGVVVVAAVALGLGFGLRPAAEPDYTLGVHRATP